MESSTAERKTERPPALDAATMCEAFQITAGAVADETALRTKDDEVTLTWGEYAEHVRKVAGGLAALGVGRGDTVAIMLTNRPEFHYADAGAMHLGATPFSIYNTYTPEQIEYLVGDAAASVVITEQAFLDRLEQAAGRRQRARARRGDRRRRPRGRPSRWPSWRTRAPTTSTSRRPGRPSSPTTSSR